MDFKRETEKNYDFLQGQKCFDKVDPSKFYVYAYHQLSWKLSIFSIVFSVISEFLSTRPLLIASSNPCWITVYPIKQRFPNMGREESKNESRQGDSNLQNELFLFIFQVLSIPSQTELLHHTHFI